MKLLKFIYYKLKNESGIVTEATVIACLGAIFLIYCGLTFLNSNNQNYDTLKAGFVEYVQNQKPDLYDEFKLAVLSGNVEVDKLLVDGMRTDAFTWFMDTLLIKDIFVACRDYLATVGTFTDTGFSYSPSSDVAMGDLTDLANFCIAHFGDDVNFTQQRIISGLQSANFAAYSAPDSTYNKVALIRCSYPNYRTTYTLWANSEAYFPTSPPYSITSNNWFWQCSQPPAKYPYSFTLTAGGAFSSDYAWSDSYYVYSGLNGSSYEVLGYFNYTGVASGGATALDLPYAPGGRVYADDPAEGAGMYYGPYIGDSLIHYPDGTVVRSGAETSVPCEDTADGVDVNDNLVDNVDERETPMVGAPPADIYAPDDSVVSDRPADSESFFARILDFFKTFWDKLVNSIVDGLKNFFLPDDGEVREMIVDIRDKFEEKFGYTGFDFNSLFGEAYEPQDFYLEDYSAGGLRAVTAKIVDVRFLKSAVLRFRTIMRAIISLLLLIYNLNQLFAFLGYAGVSLGVWHPIDNDEKPDYIKGFLSRGGRFRK